MNITISFSETPKNNPQTPLFWLILVFGVLVIVGLCYLPVKAEEYSDSAIVEAIYKAEGGSRTKHPYGIKSVKTYGNKAKAKQICLNSVKNGRKRWIEAEKPCDLITFIGLRYSPPAINPNWVKLVYHFIKKGA